MPLLAMIGGGKGLAMILLCLAVAGFIGFQKITIMGLEHDVKTLELVVKDRDLEIVRLNGEVSQCRATMDITNARISDLKETRDMQKESFNMLAENLDAFKELNSVKIQEIQDVEAPQTCELIMKYLRKGVGT
jgi:septal ring factor EnvC (AmiA/AmiB activator)